MLGRAIKASGSPTTTATPAPTLARHWLCRELTQFRRRRSLRLEDVAAHLGVAPSTLSRIETGKASAQFALLVLGWSLLRTSPCRTSCSARAASPWPGAGYRLGSDRGSPNDGSTLLSKRVMAQIR